MTTGQTAATKGVRERFRGIQSRASTRLSGIEKDARKVLDDLVRKGREGRRDLSARLSKVTTGGPWAEVKKARGRAVSYAESESRKRAAAAAENLRRVASRLDRVARTLAAARPTTGKAESKKVDPDGAGRNIMG